MKVLVLANPYSANCMLKVIAYGWKSLFAGSAQKKNEWDSLVEKKELFVIASEKEYEALFSNLKEWPGYVFIMPELCWTEDADIFGAGYKKAIDLINKKMPRYFFQLSFLSVAGNDQILSNTSAQYHSLIRSFPHHCLLNRSLAAFRITPYSAIHFELLKGLALSDSGRLSKIEHDLNFIKRSMFAVAIEESRKHLFRLVNELKTFQHYSAKELHFKFQSKPGVLEGIIQSVEEFIQDIRHSIKNTNEQPDQDRKTLYSVLVVEDDPFTQDMLQAVFEKRFSSVKLVRFNRDGVNTVQLLDQIKEEMAKYNVVLLDLFYVDREGAWLQFNGLDLYDYIKKQYPYTVCRIITSLPREVIARLSENILQNRIPISHLFSKTEGMERLMALLTGSIEEIISQCKTNEGLKHMFKPFPKLGPFNVAGTQYELHTLMLNNQERFLEYVSDGYALYRKVKEDRTFKIKLSKTSGKPDFKELEIKLPFILGYRFLLIEKSLQNEPQTMTIGVNETNDPAERQLSKQLLQTQLGFNIKAMGNKDAGERFRIYTKNFFPHEYIFMTEVLMEKEKSDYSKETDPAINEWFISILKDGAIYENFDLLGLNADLYDEEATRRSDEVVLKYDYQAIDYAFIGKFLTAVIAEISKTGVQSILNTIVNNYPYEYIPTVRQKLPKKLRAYFDRMADIDISDNG